MVDRVVVCEMGKSCSVVGHIGCVGVVIKDESSFPF